MRALQSVVLFVLPLVAACSSGGNRPPDNGAGGTVPSFAGPWSIQSELIEASAPCPPLGLESVVADFAFLLADGEAELYAVTAPGITTRSIEADTSSIHVLTSSTILAQLASDRAKNSPARLRAIRADPLAWGWFANGKDAEGQAELSRLGSQGEGVQSASAGQGRTNEDGHCRRRPGRRGDRPALQSWDGPRELDPLILGTANRPSLLSAA